MLRITDKISKKEYDEFCNRYSNSSLLQAYDWYNVKPAWDHKHIAVYDEENLVLVALILTRTVGKILKMSYIARGPVGEIGNIKYMQFFIENVKKYVKDSTFLKLDINIKECSVEVNEPLYICEYAKEVDNILKFSNYIHIPSKTMSDTIQPKFYANYYHNEKRPYENFTRNTKRTVNRNLNRYIEAEHMDISNLDLFMDFLKSNEEKNEIRLRDKAYFENLLNTFPNNYLLTFSKINYRKALNELPDKIASLRIKSSIENKKQKGYISQLESAEELYSELQKEYDKHKQDEVYISGILSIYNDKVLDQIYAGTSKDYTHFSSLIISYLKQWDWSYEKGQKLISIGGIDNSLNDHLYGFKRGFNPNIDVFLGEYDYVIKPIRYKLFDFLLNLRKKNK